MARTQVEPLSNKSFTQLQLVKNRFASIDFLEVVS